MNKFLHFKHRLLLALLAAFLAIPQAWSQTEISSAADLITAAESGFAKGSYTITGDITLGDNDTYPSVTQKAAITIAGNGHSINGLNNPLIDNCNGQDIKITDLTIDSATIKKTSSNYSDGTVSAFVAYDDAGSCVYLTNCKLTNSNLSGNSYVAGFFGYGGGGSTTGTTCYVYLTDCEVSSTTLEGGNSTGAFMGTIGKADQTSAVISNPTSKSNIITCTGESKVKAGSLIGSVNTQCSAGVEGTFIGGTITISKNTVKSGGTSNSRQFGRVGNETSRIYTKYGSSYGYYGYDNAYAYKTFNKGVCQIGTTVYASLGEALAVAKSGDEIFVFADNATYEANNVPTGVKISKIGDYVTLTDVSDQHVAKVGDTEYNTLQEAFSAESTVNGSTVTLLRDVTGVNQKLNIYKTITLDLAGHTITGTGGQLNDNATGKYAMFNISIGKHEYAVTIKSSKTGGAINVIASTPTSELYGIYLNRCTLILDGTLNVQYTGDSESVKTYGIWALDSATVNVKQGAVNVTSAKNNAAGIITFSNNPATVQLTNRNAKVTATAEGTSAEGIIGHGIVSLQGGTITATANATAYGVRSYGATTISASNARINVNADNNAFGLTVENGGGMLNMTYGSISATTTGITKGARAVYVGSTADNACKISGGYFKVSGEGAKILDAANNAITVSGGNYSTTFSNAYLADGKSFCNTTNTTYPYTVGTAAVTVTTGSETKTYNSIGTALTSISTSATASTIKLLGDLATFPTISAGMNIVIDLGGYSIGKNLASGSGVILINSSQKNPTAVTIKNGNIVGNIGSRANERHGVQISGSYANLTIDDVNITVTEASNLSSSIINVDPIRVTGNYNTVTINGGTYSGGRYGIAYIGANNTITLNGGTFTSEEGIVGNGLTANSGNTVTVNNAKFTTSIAGMSFPNNDSVSVTKTEINVSKGPGIVVRGGTINLGDGNTVTTSGTETVIIGDNSYALPAAAVIFDVAKNYSGATESASVTITGGTYTSASTVEPVQVKIEDGVTATATDYMKVSGGTFSSAIDEDYCAQNYVLVKNTDKTYGVEAADKNNSIWFYTSADDKDPQYLTGKTISITDGAYYSFNVPKDIENKNVTYTRNFPEAAYSCWYVPFDVHSDSIDNATFYMINNGIYNGGNWYLDVVKVENDTIKANIPYIILPKQSGETTFTVNNATLYSINSEVRPKKDVIFAGGVYTFTVEGIYSRKLTTEGELNWYGLAADGTFTQQTVANENIYLNPFRFFLTISRNNDYGTKSVNDVVQSAKIILVEDDSPTGIVSPLQKDSETLNRIYNLQGQKVDNPTHGIYIINGKKVYIK